MSNRSRDEALRFACDCVSVQGGYSDPWAEIAKKKLLPAGTKEEILNLVSRQPQTISQLAEALHLSAPSIYTHVNDMVRSELLRESDEWQKRYPTERYYEPNFPIVKADEQAEFEPLRRELAERMAHVFEMKRPQMERAFAATGLAARGWTFGDIAQYLFAAAQRNARELLEEQGTLNRREKRANGAEWIFWAEEPLKKNGGNGAGP
jgi:hypothetical protein